VDWGRTGAGSLRVSGHEVFDILDINNDSKLSDTDQSVEKNNEGLILDIRHGVGHFDAVGEDTFTVMWASSLSKSDFTYA
jgi:hypothetical protein